MKTLTLLAAATLLLTGAAHATTFDFNTAIGATPTFAITGGGITATFTAPAGNNYQVARLDGLLSFDPALVDNGFAGNDPLTITFSIPQTFILIPFALLDAFAPAGQDTLSVTASNGQTATYGTTPDSQTLNEPEGTIRFRPTSGITSLTLNSAQQIAIGSVSVPEPLSLALLAAGTLATGALGAITRRRRGS